MLNRFNNRSSNHRPNGNFPLARQQRPHQQRPQQQRGGPLGRAAASLYDGEATTTSLADATAGAGADDGDGAEGLSGIWQMNGNASLNNETRRRIKKDVEEINSNLTGAAREVTAETKARDELHKSQQRGRREQSKHRFDATQTHDALKFGSEVLRGLRETMHAEIKARYAAKQQPRPSGSGSDGNGNGDSPGDGGGSEDGGNGGNGTGSITPAAIRENVKSSIRDEMEKLAAETASEIELLRKAKLRKAEIVQEGASGGKQGGGGGAAGDVAAANSSSSSSSNDELESKLEELRDDNKIKQRELDAERARASALEINDEKITKETQELDRQVAELTKLLEAKKRGDGAKEAEKSSLLKAAKEEAARHEKALVDFGVKLTNLESVGRSADESIAGAESLFKERDNSKRLTEQERSARNKIFSERSKAVASLTAGRAELDKQVGALLKAESDADADAKLKESNDKMEAEYHPLRDELDGLVGEVAEFEALIKSIGGEVAEAEGLDAATDGVVEAAGKLQGELEGMAGPLSEKRSTYDAEKRSLDEYKVAVDLLQHLLDGSEAHRRDISAYEEAQVERAEYALAANWDRKLKILRLGDQEIDNTRKEEREIDDGRDDE